MDRQKEYKSENKMKDCLAYFHLSPVWEKVLKGFREKYISYGRFGGKVILKNLKPTDIEELEGFFGKSFHSQKSVTVSAEKFRQALETSRYKEITPECLLENFFEEPLLGRQEQKSLREQEKERIWDIFQRDYEETPVETALESLRSIVKDNGSQELAKWDKMLRLGAEIYNCHIAAQRCTLPYLQLCGQAIHMRLILEQQMGIFYIRSYRWIWKYEELQ